MRRGLVLVLVIVLGAALWVTIAWILFGPEEPQDVELTSTTEPAREEPLRVDATADAPTPTPSEADGGGAQSPVPLLLPHQQAPTPMVQAIKDSVGSSSRRAEIAALSPPLEMVADEQAFAAESVDRQWATAAEANILGRIAQVSGLTVTDLQVECRTTMCRMQIVEPRRATPDPNRFAFVDLVDDGFGLKPLWLISLVNPIGGLTSVGYFRRVDPAAELASP